MEKKPEVDGAYAELEATELAGAVEEMNQSNVLVIVNARLELAGRDKEQFVAKFSGMLEELKEETEGMDDKQKSFYVLRQMLIS